MLKNEQKWSLEELNEWERIYQMWGKLENEKEESQMETRNNRERWMS